MLPELEKDHRVIRVDLLGHGGSEKPGRGLHDRQPGFDGRGGAQPGRRRPGDGRRPLARVRGGNRAGREEPRPGREAVNIDEAPDNGYCDYPFLTKLGYWPLFGPATYRATPDWAVRDAIEVDFAPGYNLAQGFENPDLPVDSYREMTYSSYKKTASDQDDFVSEKPLDERLAALAAPIPLLVIFGTEDQVCDAEASADAYRDVPGASVSMVEGSGHSPNVEKPQETSALVLEFAANPGDEAAPAKPEFTPQTRASSRTTRSSRAVRSPAPQTRPGKAEEPRCRGPSWNQSCDQSVAGKLCPGPVAVKASATMILQFGRAGWIRWRVRRLREPGHGP